MEHTTETADGTLNARAARRRLLGNRVRQDELAAALGVTTRSIYGWCVRGLPYVRADGVRWFDIDVAREWLTKQGSQRPKPEPLPPPRSPGRPRKRLE